MAWTDYAARFLGPTYLERDRANPLRLSIYANGESAVTVTSGTFYLYDDTNTAIVNGTAIAVEAGTGVATITVAAATLAASSFGSGWRVEWHLVMPDGFTHVFRNRAALVRVRLPQAATEADLLRLHPDLRSYLPAGKTNWQDQLDVAHEYAIVAWLERMGRRPYLVIDVSALTALHTFETLAIIGHALGGDGDETNRWVKLAARYEAKAKEARDSIVLEYDETDSGQAATGRRTAGTSTVWLAGAPEEDTWAS